MTSIIPTAVLRAAVLSAFDRGRYQVHFGTAPAGDDIAVVPTSINLDLAERDDDLLNCDTFELFTDAEAQELRREVSVAFAADDHGPTVPTDGWTLIRRSVNTPRDTGPIVYEFALQEAVAYNGFRPVRLDAATQNHAPDYVAASNADWVHVYDRVTRERRTLKRPGEDRVVKVMADVAHGKSSALCDAVAAALGDDPAMRRAAVEAGYASLKDYVEAPAPAPVSVPAPAPGPLTSAEGLVRGDVVMCRNKPTRAFVGRVAHISADRLAVEVVGRDRASFCNVSDCSFIGRPDADGWMDWPGGENPVPGASVFTLTAACRAVQNKSEDLDWSTSFTNPIHRFRLVDLPALPSET
jgi:hypothetical protein